MGRSMALLHREIYFSDDEALSGRLSSIRCPWEGRDDLPSRQEISDAVTGYLRTFKAHAVVADPPALSFLHILRPPVSVGLPVHFHSLTMATLSSADKNLVAMYAGGYRPGNRFPGGYLIYDARNDSISGIPELPSDHSHRAIGCESAVVMCEAAAAGNDYFLAELVRVWPDGSQAALWLWKSSVQKWDLHPSRVPLPSSTTGHFSPDLCFSCWGSVLCWVDLLKGMVLCDLKQNCKFSFIQLPKDCPTYDADSDDFTYSSAEEFRSMACVAGEIKFVALDECDEHQPEKGLELTMWTLSHDLSGWKESCKYNVENIWANEAYKPAGIRNLPPSYPVLSIHEDGVVYLVLNDLRELDYGLEHMGQWMLRVDIGNDKVQFYPNGEKNSVNSLLFASEFSAHRQHLQDHPREIEASEFVAGERG
ncbi:uncharacterized protein [Aegilops tauschii subsp. strangulata]|uniref:DUF1618 domain-containing protein n=1 Tax=Aegilops tauschii subsp. strangulata TaxID=200361 RepID=A0A453A904_AEGTS|nr:uncharacterized protein LOC109748106 [Aegilops tauschii subsp. strangulata]